MPSSDIIALAHVAATLLVGFGQIAVVVWGIRAMLAANKVRSAGAEEATRLADQRHKEAMAAHVETMAAHAETMAAYKAQGRGRQATPRRSHDRAQDPDRAYRPEGFGRLIPRSRVEPSSTFQRS